MKKKKKALEEQKKQAELQEKLKAEEDARKKAQQEIDDQIAWCKEPAKNLWDMHVKHEKQAELRRKGIWKE